MANFSVWATNALWSASQIAISHKCSTVNATHLLLALIRENLVVKTMLIQAGVDLVSLDFDLIKEIKTGCTDSTISQQGQSEGITPGLDVLAVLEHARQEAQLLGHVYTGGESFLLGILQLENSAPSLNLNRLGVNLEGMRQSIRAMEKM